jgi:NADH-quinone oxidoreductase subunit N
VTAFLSAGAKFAAFGGLLRLLSEVPAQNGPWPQVLGALAILTLLAGNLGALKQQSLKRLLAYSSIAHSGYALVGFLGLGVKDGSAVNAVLSYVLIYGVMNFLAFALVSALELQLNSPDGKRSALLGDLQGLGFERPWFGLAVAVAMRSGMRGMGNNPKPGHSCGTADRQALCLFAVALLVLLAAAAGTGIIAADIGGSRSGLLFWGGRFLGTR